MDLDRQLQNSRAKLASVKEGREISLEKYKAELDQREKQNERADSLEAFRTWVSSYEINSAKQIEDLEAQIAELERQVNTPEYQAQLEAQENLEGLRGTAESSWIAGGGSAEDFEGAWSKLKFAYLQKQVLEAMDKAR